MTIDNQNENRKSRISLLEVLINGTFIEIMRSLMKHGN